MRVNIQISNLKTYSRPYPIMVGYAQILKSICILIINAFLKQSRTLSMRLKNKAQMSQKTYTEFNYLNETQVVKFS